MSHQHPILARAAIIAAARDRADRSAPTASPQREKGLWSFLTWSFFLSQVAAAEQFIGSPAHASPNDEGAPHPVQGAPRAASDIADPPSAGSHVGENAANGATQFASLAPDAGSLASSPGIPMHLSGAATGPTVSSAAHGHGAPGVAAVVVEVVGGDSSSDPHGGTDPAAPGLLPELPVGGDVPTGLLDDVTSLADNLLQGGVDVVLQTIQPLLHDTVNTAVDLVDSANTQIVQPLVGEVAETLETVSPVLGQTVAPLLTVVGDVVPHLDGIIDTLAEPAGIVAPVPSVIEGALNILPGPTGSDGIVASGGSVAFHDPVVNVIGLDELFSGGRYTDYGISLNTPAQPTVSAIGTASGTEGGASVVALLTTGGHESGDDAHAPHSLLPSVLEELHLQGSSAGISL